MILDEIVRHKRAEVAAAKQRRPLAAIEAELEAVQADNARQLRDFRAALADRGDVALIAEIKRSSPSAGLIRADFDPATIAGWYRDAGAAALSVLTDERYFGGRLEFVEQARAASSLPILRKDFVIDRRQLIEARLAGADAVLLIVRILSDDELTALLGAARALGMAALVEAHDADEVRRAVDADAELIGVNNRDLDTLTVDLAVTERLAELVPPDRVLVSESGVHSRADVARVAAAGAKAVLVGQHLMSQENVTAAARELVRVPRR
jgi:indole-3-glycerol phosphate synthase